MDRNQPAWQSDGGSQFRNANSYDKDVNPRRRGLLPTTAQACRSARSVFLPGRALIPVRVPACRSSVGTSLRHAPKCRRRRLCNSFNSKGARTGHCFAITMSERRSGTKHDKVIRVAPTETLEQANAVGAHVALRTSQRGSPNSECRTGGDVRGDAYANVHKFCSLSGARCSGCLCGLAGFAVCCPRSRRTYRTWKWLGNCAHGLGRVDCSRTTAGRS